MASSPTHIETPPTVWSGLARLRDLSRLILAAAAENDLARMERYGSESEALVQSLSPELEAHCEDPEAQRLLREIALLQTRVRSEMECLARETTEDLARLRMTRGRFRALRLHGDHGDADHVNRSS